MAPKMAPDLLRREPAQHAMNPASVVWPEWPGDEPVTAQKTRRARRADEPVTIINEE